ncbi:MAG TPA: His-Xaa-Ser system protein HxsD [Candidatus Acetothermia bacterium]|nr:His-Xaa-Ser system protein HxsD [Candidatus Acetothermia bacterium]
MSSAPSASAFEDGSDSLGVYVRVSVDPKVFSEIAILKTAYWFTDNYYLYLANNRVTGLLDVEFRLKQGDDIGRLKAVCGEFLNGMLDQAVRQRVLEETAGVRDTLLKKAFFEAKLPSPAGVLSDESRLPAENQSYASDPIKIGQQD